MVVDGAAAFPFLRRRLLVGGVAALVVPCGLVWAEDGDPEAAGVVGAFAERMARLGEPYLGAEERRVETTAIVDELLALPAMASNAVGLLRLQAWSAEQRDAVVDAFRHYTSAVLAGRAIATDFSSLVVGDMRAGPAGAVVVDATIGDDVVSFLVVRDNGAWRLMDVVRDGVSELALRRSEFSATAAEGAEVLVERLQQRTAALVGELP